MIESTSSWTNLSGSNPNFSQVQGTISKRKDAPAAALFEVSHSASRAATPGALGMPPMPGGRSSTRRLSVIANWPSRKKASRGVVAIQFGLPRPALMKETADTSDAACACSIRKSLISKGLSFSYVFRFITSMIRLRRRGRGSAGHQDHCHAKDCEQRVAHRVGHAVAQCGHLALGAILNHPERRGRGPRARANAEEDGGVEFEYVP